MRPAEGRLHRGIGWNDESRRSQQEQDPWGPRLRGIVRCPRTMQRIPRKARLEDSKFGDFALVLDRVTARASRRQQSKRRVLPYLCLGVVGYGPTAVATRQAGGHSGPPRRREHGREERDARVRCGEYHGPSFCAREAEVWCKIDPAEGT